MPKTVVLNNDVFFKNSPPENPVGKVGKSQFEAQTGGDPARAAQSHRPVPAKRHHLNLTLVTSNPPPTMGSAGAGASTPDSGVMGSLSSYTLDGDPASDSGSSKYPEFKNPFYGDVDVNAGNVSPAVASHSSKYPEFKNPFHGDVDVNAGNAGPAVASDSSEYPESLSAFSGASDVGEDTDAEEKRIWQKPVERGNVPIPRAKTASRRQTQPVHHSEPSANAPPTLHMIDALTRRISMPAPLTASAHSSIDHETDNGYARIEHPARDLPVPPPPALTQHAANAQPGGARNAAFTRISPSIAHPPMTAPTSADQHPDVRLALSSLRSALERATAHAPASPDKASRPTGDTRLRAIARSRRASDNPLGDRSLAFYKTLMRPPGTTQSAGNKRIAVSLAALAQRAAGEGYDAVATQLIKRTLTPVLHSLPLETLSELSRLKSGDDRNTHEILLKVADLLGANKGRRTRKVEQAERELEVASALLSVVGELCHENARALSWDRQVAVAVEAAQLGRHEQLDAALREIWRGDLLTGEMERPRVNRLMDAIGRLAMDQRYALATMLGLTVHSDARSDNFEEFEERYLAEFEHDEAVRRQMIKFIAQLRIATRAMLPQEARDATGFGMARNGVGNTLEPAYYPPALKRGQTVKTAFARFGEWVAASLRRSPKTRDAAKAQIKQAVLTLVEGGRLTAEQLNELQSANRRLNGKLGQATGASVHHMLIQDRLSKLAPDEMARLAAYLATTRDGLPSNEQNPGHDVIASFHNELFNAHEREAGIRRGAAALTRLMDTLPKTRHPERLLDALDALADAEIYAVDRQSELDFYEETLRRLGPQARKTLHKRLNGRGGIQRYMTGIDALIWHTPAAWSHYRWHQLNTLARAVQP